MKRHPFGLMLESSDFGSKKTGPNRRRDESSRTVVDGTETRARVEDARKELTVCYGGQSDALRTIGW